MGIIRRAIEEHCKQHGIKAVDLVEKDVRYAIENKVKPLNPTIRRAKNYVLGELKK